MKRSLVYKETRPVLELSLSFGEPATDSHLAQTDSPHPPWSLQHAHIPLCLWVIIRLTIYSPPKAPVLLCNAGKVVKVAQDGRKELHNTLCTHYNCHWKPVWGIFLSRCLSPTQQHAQQLPTHTHSHSRTPRTPPLLRRSNRTFWTQFNLPPELHTLAQINASVTQVLLAARRDDLRQSISLLWQKKQKFMQKSSPSIPDPGFVLCTLT